MEIIDQVNNQKYSISFGLQSGNIPNCTVMVENEIFNLQDEFLACEYYDVYITNGKIASTDGIPDIITKDIKKELLKIIKREQTIN